MAKKSFSIGILDKAGRMVKGESGWLPLKGNEALIDWTLEENARHKEGAKTLESKTEAKVNDPKPLGEKKKSKKEKQTVTKEDIGSLEEVLDDTKELEVSWQKEQYDWGKILAIKLGNKCVVSLTEDNVKACVLSITTVKKEEDKAVIEFSDKEGAKGVMMNLKQTPKTVKILMEGDHKADYYLPYEAFNFSKEVNDFRIHKETPEEKKVKKQTIEQNNQARHNAKDKNTPPKHAK